jgi:hypothetical protein
MQGSAQPDIDEDDQYEGNFLYLLVSMILMILVSSTLSHMNESLAHLIWELMIMGTLILGVWTLAHDKAWFYTGVALSAIIVILVIVAEVSKTAWIAYLIILCWYVFYLMAFTFTVKAVLMTREITANNIIGAICIFMMAAYLWGMAYNVIAIIEPEAFRGLDPAEPISGKFTQLNYFSFVTITTLGFGDISPVLPIAQSLAVLEAMFGQFFIAIFVAGMVGIHVANKLDTRRSG